jgi:multidrug efflux pump subunit AcrA (membrane-fusion protein)
MSIPRTPPPHATHDSTSSPQTKAPFHVAADQAAQVGAATLLAAESRVRAAKDELELHHLVVNELRRLVAGRQCILVRMRHKRKAEVVAVSSLALTDKDTPFTRWIAGLVLNLLSQHGEADAVEFALPAFVDPDDATTRNYPFRHLVWQPMRSHDGRVFAGVLIAREQPWSEQDKKVITRETGVFASFWQALHGAKALRPRERFSSRARLAVAAALLALMLLPVPMTTLAPIEIVAKSPQRVTSPIDGVIKEILVDPNRPVRQGEPILRFDQTTFRNRYEIAEQERLLAAARYDRLTQASFVDEKARHELALARAELDLKQADSDYAADLLKRTVISAERDGVLIYSDKDRWIGRPLKTGERIMYIARADEVAARIEVPVADAIVLDRGARARLFLDANPLTAVPARLVSEGYHAEPNSTQQLVYRVHAEFDGSHEGLRIGARGTAQLVGNYVPLSFYLLRRPISSARQHLGL